jgi:hypothetical protein
MPLTYLPDGPRTGPGVLLDVGNLVALPNGNYRTVNGPSTAVTSTNLPGKCYGMFVPVLVDGSSTYYWAVNDAHSSATKTKLYRAASFGGAAASVSKSGDYAVDTRWRFANWGNLVIATNNSDAPQSYTEGTSTLFANLAATAPDKAALVETVGDWVFLADYQVSGGGATYRDGWTTCNISDPTTWNGGSAANQFSGRITDTGGPITAMRKHAGGVVMFKRNAVYFLQFLDSTLGWGKTQVGIDTGTFSNEHVVSANGVLYYIDGQNRDFMAFDGSRPVSLTGGNARGIWSRFFLQDSIRALWSFNSLSPSIFGVHDSINKNIIWFYDSGDGTEALSGYSKAWISYNYISGKWGAGNTGLQMDWAISDSRSSTSTFGYLQTHYGLHSLVTYYNNTNRVSYAMNGVTQTATLKTGYKGDNNKSTALNKVRPVFAAPLDDDTGAAAAQIPTGTMTLRYTQGPIHGVITSMSSDTNWTWSSTQREFYGTQDARWFSAEISMAPANNTDEYWELTDVEFMGATAGSK